MSVPRAVCFFGHLPSHRFSTLAQRMFLLSAVSGVVFCQMAQATEEVDFKPSGEFRARYFNDINGSGLTAGSPPGAGQKADSAARLTTNLLARKGETLQAYGSFLYNLQFGADNTYDGVAGMAPSSTVSENNSLLVNRAWGLWKVTNSVIAKVGRLGLAFGDGSVFSENTWERVPTAHDGIDVLWDVDAVKLRLIGIKTHEYSTLPNLGAGGAGPVTSTTNDPERNFYGVSADIRNLPAALKSANFHAFQINSDSVTDGTSSRGRDNWEHYGFSLVGDYQHFEYRLAGAYQTGHIGIFQAAVADSAAQNLSANMIDFELNYSVPDWAGFKVAAGGHRDSGSDHTQTTRAYQPLYYDRHSFSGLMDTVGWGNVTYGDLIFSIAPREDFEIGLGTYVFMRSQAATGVNFGERFTALSTAQTNGDFAASRALIGTEVDLFAARTFESNFKLDAHVALFIPGAYLRDGPVAHNQTLAQVMVEGVLPF